MNKKVRGSDANRQTSLAQNECPGSSILLSRILKGMNAKRSRDRFFKPGLESSSLSIPAILMANVAERIRREIVALVYAGSSPVVRPEFD